MHDLISLFLYTFNMHYYYGMTISCKHYKYHPVKGSWEDDNSHLLRLNTLSILMINLIQSSKCCWFVIWEEKMALKSPLKICLWESVAKIRKLFWCQHVYKSQWNLILWLISSDKCILSNSLLSLVSSLLWQCYLKLFLCHAPIENIKLPSYGQGIVNNEMLGYFIGWTYVFLIELGIDKECMCFN